MYSEVVKYGKKNKISFGKNAHILIVHATLLDNSCWIYDANIYFY